MNTEDLLRQNAPLAQEALFASLPAPEDCGHRFSSRFERKMRPLLRRQAHPVRSLVLRRAAAVFLACLVSASLWLTVDTGARAAFFQWVREVYETHIVYRFFGEPVKKIGIYRAAWLPEGYKESNSSDSMVVYMNETGDMLTFSYALMQEGTSTGMFSEGMQAYPVNICDLPGDFYLSSNPDIPNSMVWIDEEIDLAFNLSGNLSKSDMLSIAESIFLVESTN